MLLDMDDPIAQRLLDEMEWVFEPYTPCPQDGCDGVLKIYYNDMNPKQQVRCSNYTEDARNNPNADGCGFRHTANSPLNPPEDYLEDGGL